MQPLLGLVVDAASAYGRGVALGAARFMQEQAQPMRIVFIADIGSLKVEPWKGAGIIGQFSPHHAPIAHLMRQRGVAIVNVSDARPVSDMPTVHADNHAIGRLAAHYYLHRGFRSLAFFGQEGALFSQQRCSGFTEAAGDCRLSTLHTDATIPDHKFPQAREQLRQWLESLPRPTGAMCCNDVYAKKLAEACHVAGIRVPDDLAIVGVDDDDMICRMSAIPLSSIDPDAHRIGYEAAALLAQQLDGRPLPPSPLCVPPRRLITRLSSDILAVADPLVSQAMRLIRQLANTPAQAGDIAARLDVSRRTLERRFRQSLNRSPGDELESVRIQRVKDLLLDSDLAIQDIAVACGFTDRTQLAHAFRRLTHTSPSAYRQQHRME